MPEINPSSSLSALEAVALDCETTGLDAASARIVQFGALRVEGTRLLLEQKIGRLIAPGIAIPPATTKIHGITDADVRDAPTFREVAEDIQAFIGTSIVIGHTVSYDLAILEREAKLAGRPWTRPRSLDVRMLATLANPELAHYDLDRLAQWLRVPVEGRHTAFGDALMTAKIFAALVPLLRRRGIRTLAEVEAASRAVADRQIGAGLAPAETLPHDTQVIAGTSRPRRVEGFAYRHRVRDVMTSPPARLAPAATVSEAMRLMLARRISSVLIDDAAGQPGIFTERDLLRVLDSHGPAGLDAAVAEFASRPLHTTAENDFLYRAIGRIQRLGVRHLGVTAADGSVTGIVTTRNLLRERASSAIALGDAIDQGADAPALARAWSELPGVAASLLADDTDPRVVAAVISAEITALTRRAAQLGEQRMLEAGRGPPPVPYAVLVLGSVGRGESLLAADQDNAIVYASGQPDGPEDQWFASLGAHIADLLDEVGVPYCKGGVMAKNTAWRHSTAGWRETINGWGQRQRPEDLLNVDIFFDGQSAHGDHALADDILDNAYAGAQHARSLLLQLTELARQPTSALTWLGNIKTDSNGRIDLKKAGLLPIFTAARVKALRHGIRARSTPDRLEAIQAAGAGSQEDVEALIAAHKTILGLMLAQQLRDSEVGIALSPRVAVKQLTHREVAALKDALGHVQLAASLAGDGRP